MPDSPRDYYALLGVRRDATGRVTGVSAGPIALELLMAAIEDAGYEVTA